MSDILSSEDQGVVTLTLNRPASRNGVTFSLLERLFEQVSAVARSDARVLILTGAGKDFCVGADIKAAVAAGAEPMPDYATTAHLYQVATLLHAMPQITIAAIDGGCAGAGLGWACACDFRFASTRAKFATAFLKVGAVGDMGTAWSLSRIVGGARAREMLFLDEKFGAAEALGWNLVTRIFEPEALAAETQALAARLAAAPPETLRLMKANMVSAETLDMAAFVEIETARHLHAASSLQSGFADFLANRSS